MCIKMSKCQTISPFLLVEIKQHLLFKFIFPVVNGYGVVMPVQSMDQCLNSGNKDRSATVKKKKSRTSASKRKKKNSIHITKVLW